MRSVHTCQHLDFPETGDSAYELRTKQGVTNIHSIYYSPILFFNFGIPKGRPVNGVKSKKYRMRVISEENTGNSMRVIIIIVLIGFPKFFNTEGDTNSSKYIFDATRC